jgi:LmbE family N-acetylglucosaminyl deacetylase
MTADEYFRLVEAMPVGSIHDLTAGRPFIVLSPHPDDESLGVGGLIALARGNGLDVAVVLLTDGSQSHPNSLAYPRDRLIATRRSELEDAARILGLASDRLFELGLPDAGAPVSGADFERAVQGICALISSMGANTIFVTWEHDPHCDHEAAAHMAKEVRVRCPHARLWSYPVWGWHLPHSHILSAPSPVGVRLSVDDVLSQKREAIGAHSSQMTDLIRDDPDGFRFTPETLSPFLRPYEYYIEVPR